MSLIVVYFYLFFVISLVFETLEIYLLFAIDRLWAFQRVDSSSTRNRSLGRLVNRLHTEEESDGVVPDRKNSTGHSKITHQHRNIYTHSDQKDLVRMEEKKGRGNLFVMMMMEKLYTHTHNTKHQCVCTRPQKLYLALAKEFHFHSNERWCAARQRVKTWKQRKKRIIIII